jgi:hypothetical protein
MTSLSRTSSTPRCSELKPGAPVFINAQRQPDGTLAAPRVNVGLHGQVPPM